MLNRTKQNIKYCLSRMTNASDMKIVDAFRTNAADVAGDYLVLNNRGGREVNNDGEIWFINSVNLQYVFDAPEDSFYEGKMYDFDESYQFDKYGLLSNLLSFLVCGVNKYSYAYTGKDSTGDDFKDVSGVKFTFHTDRHAANEQQQWIIEVEFEITFRARMFTKYQWV